MEYVPEAIADAKVNSELNGIENTVFYAGDMKAVLDDGFVAANGRPDVIILDPPRAGVDEPVIEVIPVSYTHLDVYKRQIRSSKIKKCGRVRGLLFVEQVGAQALGAFVGLVVLPFGDLGEVARQ